MIPVSVTTNEYRMLLVEAQRRDRFRSYRSDGWQGGQNDAVTIDGVGTVTKSQRAILVGLVGEKAFQRHVNKSTGETLLTLDIEDRKRGDGGIDFDAAGVLVQLKTRQPRNGRNLIRKEESPVAADVFVFAQWEPLPTPQNPVLLGWIECKQALFLGRNERGTGDWVNLVLTDSQLKPMHELITRIQSRLTTTANSK